MDVEVQHIGDGVLLYGGHTEGPGPVAFDVWDGTVWAADLPGDAYFHHDAKLIDDGRVLTLEEREVSDGGQAWTGFAIRGFDPATLVDGVPEVSFDWDSQVGVDQGALSPGWGDAWHANWFQWIDHGAGPVLYVSLCNTAEVVKIDVTSGEVEWVFGEGGDFELDGGSRYTQCQHGLDVSADGTRMLAYDNGRDRGESRVVEYELDQTSLTASEVWSWTDGWYESLVGDVDWLADGTVLVTQAHSECYGESDRSEVVQVDPATGDERWRLAFVDPLIALYRSELVDGCELFANVGQCPALEARWAELAPAFGL
jgi:hypothetical protein